MIEWISISSSWPPHNKDVILTDGKNFGVTPIILYNSIPFIKFGRCRNISLPKYWAKLPKKLDKNWIEFCKYKAKKESILVTDGKEYAILTYSSARNKIPSITRYLNKITYFMYLPELP
jgi:hypothetical protein